MPLQVDSCALLRPANNRLRRLFTGLGKCSESKHLQGHSELKRAIQSMFLRLAPYRKQLTVSLIHDTMLILRT